FFDDIYVGPEILDTQAPVPLSLSIESVDELRLAFSEGVEPSSAQDPQNYSLDQSFGNPLSVSVDPGNPAEVVLSFGNAFAPNLTYTLSISNISDNSGNVMPQTLDLSVTNVVVANPVPGDVIFNEILPDPTPSVGLPTTEYVELFNRSSKVLNLQGWTLSNGSTNASLPNRVLQPGEYILFSRASDTALFSVPVIGLSSWPALVNGGDELGLFDPSAIAIDAIAYTTDWYQDESKEDGGYSLERINPDPITCPAIANWTASLAVDGGTPGAQNSVFNQQTETDPPQLLSASVLSGREILLRFDEPMDSLLLADLAAYTVQPILGTPDQAVPQGPDFVTVLLSFVDSLDLGQEYGNEIRTLWHCLIR
ncbi:MAG: lamin tail domain-containing protein, partial [Bacteroidota bacterium]